MTPKQLAEVAISIEDLLYALDAGLSTTDTDKLLAAIIMVIRKHTRDELDELADWCCRGGYRAACSEIERRANQLSTEIQRKDLCSSAPRTILEGLKLADGQDAQEYVDELRGKEKAT